MGASLSGCLGSDAPSLAAGSNAPFAFEWIPPGTPEVGYLVELSTGEAECAADAVHNGRLTHPTGLGAFSYQRSSEWGGESVSGVIARIDDGSVHAREFNSAHSTGAVWGRLWQYGSGAGWQVPPHTNFTGMLALFHLTEESRFRLSCTSQDVHLRFYEADMLVPIMSGTATGGRGAHVWDPVTDTRIQWNDGDVFEGTTLGDLVFLQVFDGNVFGAGIGQPYYEGRLGISRPGAQESVEWRNDHPNVTRFWSAAGGYEVRLHRYAMNVDGLMGLLAGFALVEEHGPPGP